MRVASYRNTEASIRRIRQMREPPVVATAPVEVEQPEPVVYQSEYQKIEARAIKLFRVTRADLRSKRRQEALSFARQFVMYWAYRRTTLSCPQIGRLLGKRDHTSILHGKGAYVEKRAAMGRTLRPAR